MKSYKKWGLDLINYLMFQKNKWFIYRNYKIVIKDLGCNAKCPICEDWKNNWDIKKINENLIKAFKEVAKENVKFKSIQILWWEPILIFNSVCKIIEAWTKLWIKFDFPTNAGLLSYYKINKLIKLWLDNFTFSLDFPDEKHDKWRNLEWAFKKICDFTKYIQKKWIKVQWNSVVGKFNLSEIDNFKKLYKNFKPDIHSFIYIEENWWQSKYNKLSNEEIVKVKEKINSLKADNIEIILNWFETFENKKSICYVPLKTKKIIVTQEKIYNSLCYYKWEIKNEKAFIKNALENWCDMCEASFKYNYNEMFNKLLPNTNKI